MNLEIYPDNKGIQLFYNLFYWIILVDCSKELIDYAL